MSSLAEKVRQKEIAAVARSSDKTDEEAICLRRQAEWIKRIRARRRVIHDLHIYEPHDIRKLELVRMEFEPIGILGNMLLDVGAMWRM